MTDFYCPSCQGTGRRAAWPDDKIAMTVRHMRITAGLTQETVAQRMGVSPQYVCDLERARRAWSPDLVSAYLTALEDR